MNASQRSCAHCTAPLPADSTSRRRYCSPRCRKAAARTASDAATRLARLEAEVHQLKLRRDVLEHQVLSLSTENGQLRGRVRDRDERIHRLAGQLSAEKRTADRAIRGQVGRTLAVRDELDVRTDQVANLSADRDRVATELVTATATLSELRRSWTLTGGRTPDSQEVATLRRTLAGVRADRDRLATAYDELSAAVDSYVAERRQVQRIVRQWDRLCRRLDKATGGRPRTEADRHILATWRAFHRAVSGQASSAGGADRAGGAR